MNSKSFLDMLDSIYSSFYYSAVKIVPSFDSLINGVEASILYTSLRRTESLASGIYPEHSNVLVFFSKKYRK